MLYESSRSPGLLTAYDCPPGTAVNSDVSPLVNQFSFVHFCICHSFLVYALASFAIWIPPQFKLSELVGATTKWLLASQRSCPSLSKSYRVFCTKAVHIGFLSIISSSEERKGVKEDCRK